jgi:hypothetical protein
VAVVSLPVRRSFGETTRRDRWWVIPLLTFVGLGSFVVYATWAAFQGEHYHHGPYLSPFYSPELWHPPGKPSHHAWFGELPGWWPGWLPFSPALLILWAPAGFRLTCYYYRGAYYKAFWADPPSCAVGEPRKGYIGESSLPLILQNVHRYFLYVAIIFIGLLAYDAVRGFIFEKADHTGYQFGIGVGSLVLVLNVFLLGGYTFGCHSLRHLVGGRMDCVSKNPTCHKLYKGCSALNRRHPLWAWASLFGVMFADVYVRLCSMGIWTDWRIV